MRAKKKGEKGRGWKWGGKPRICIHWPREGTIEARGEFRASGVAAGSAADGPDGVHEGAPRPRRRADSCARKWYLNRNLRPHAFPDSLVLGCINVDFCNQIVFSRRFSRFTHNFLNERPRAEAAPSSSVGCKRPWKHARKTSYQIVTPLHLSKLKISATFRQHFVVFLLTCLQQIPIPNDFTEFWFSSDSDGNCLPGCQTMDASWQNWPVELAEQASGAKTSAQLRSCQN